MNDTIIGRPMARVDGALKVTGQAPYAYEYPAQGVVYGVMATATIARGRVASIDTGPAFAVPGVLHVMTSRNAPSQHRFGPGDATGLLAGNRFLFARPVLADDQVRYHGEPVALVLAETFEAARDGAARLDVRYAIEPARCALEPELARAYRPDAINAGMETDTTIGDFEADFARAAVTVDARYRTPYQKHNAMEPHAALAEWREGGLVVHTSTQSVANTRKALAKTLGIDVARVRLHSPYVGGGFGAKLGMQPEVVFAALAAGLLRRPVKVAQTRQQMFATVGHRPEMIQRVRLAADATGRLSGIAHEAWMQTSPHEEFAEQAAAFTRSLYAAPNRITRHRLVPLDLPPGDTMRAPGEAPGMMALEAAMDELASTLGMDPIALRIRNEPAVDPERRVPFSSRPLVRCMNEGARRFGWDQRPTRPASRREGDRLIGYGMAAAIRPNYMRNGAASVAMDAAGRVTARLDMTDIGTGTYTILTQIAADALGVPPASVEVRLGDSAFPENWGSGGSFGATSSGVALHGACVALRAKLAAAAGRPELRIVDGQVRAGGAAEPIATFMARVAPAGLSAEYAHTGSGKSYTEYSQHSFGAHFAEVAVDALTGEVRLRRMLGVFDAGRVFNPRLARSQLIGGMIWGVGAALLEEGVVDPRFGHFVNAGLGEYHVAVAADVPEVDAVILETPDDKANVFGAKGVGELGTCGSAAAVANAVFNACGIRVRDYPITVEKVLAGLPDARIRAG